MAEREFDDHGEILRLRNNYHRLNKIVLSHSWRLDALEAFRKEYKPLVDEIIQTDKIAEAVTAKMSRDHSLQLSRLQQTLAVLAVVAAISSPIVAALHG